MKIRKAIIPAAGLGTRFLPATKAQPKEMLPIVDKPTIQYIVEEAVLAGIEDIIIISGRGKRAIEDHFDKSYELEETLLKKGKLEQLQKMESISRLANIHYIRQKEPRGLGDAIYCAKSFIGNEPFAVMLGDDIVQSEVPCMEQLIKVYEQYRSSVIGVQTVSDEEVSKYGIIEPDWNVTDQILQVRNLVEKPSLDAAPSNLAVMGRYILEPQIFPILETLAPGAGNEIQLTDAIQKLTESRPVYSYLFEGKRYDVGDKLGFIKATIEIGLEREDLKEDLRIYLKQLTSTIQGVEI
ncbi:UTP--glucose-1-phosphate uridylyltransferase GalU [Cytobacillus spongiae]|uniref:UTP--glucose-1-phosphate uridylyltransferase GalU n=1 Tax=Cytobacillus spongiae TaxID=2901381 RepID=UPI001F246B3A|nr:UTP--glucose-1-phosphate uridylyltransferase GalU [Cytobacillus spongiae]UII55845.1 UTP--glucose-1-phosphate uridylyltransferase GalU [Cytobacillus spongiae]